MREEGKTFFSSSSFEPQEDSMCVPKVLPALFLASEKNTFDEMPFFFFFEWRVLTGIECDSGSIFLRGRK